MRWLCVVAFSLVLSASAASQVVPHRVNVKLDLQSPHSTLRTFLLALQPQNNNVALAAQTIDFSQDISQKKRQKLTRKLKRVLDARGLIVEMSDVPRDSTYIDSASGASVYVPFPDAEDRIYLRRERGKWKFSSFTIAAVPQMYEEVYPYGIDRLVDALPHDGPQLFGYELWQIVGLLVLIGIGVLLGWLIGTVLLWLFGFFFRRWGRGEDTAKIIHTAIRPLSLGIGFTFALAFVPLLQLPVESSRVVLLGMQGIIALCVIMIVYRLSDLVWYRLHQRAAETESPYDDAIIPLVEQLTKFLIVVIGLLLLFQTWDFNITALLAGLSIGGVALAFAAQDSIKNIFGSLMIFIDRPFQIGDWVKVDGQDGNIESIGFRSTRIRTFANSLLTIPNGRLADMTIDNMGLRAIRRYSTTLGIQYNTPPEKIEEFVKGLRQIVLDHPNTVKEDDKLLIYFHTYDQSSLNILVYIYFELPNWREELTAREEINLAFLRFAKEIGVQYAFPTRTVHVASGTSPQPNQELNH